MGDDRRARGAMRGARAPITTAVAVALLGLAACGSAARPSPGVPSPPGRHALYRPPRPLPRRAPGTPIWAVPVKAPPGARAWKVLYHSRALTGRDIAVSGVVVAPETRPPRGGFPIWSFAHGTVGIADTCAPSRQPDAITGLPYLSELIRRGFVVTATDYEGLGTPGRHPYIVGESEARGVLDIARAARHMHLGAGATLVAFGHSQGGHAVLFAGQISAQYAPELHLVGVVAAAPAAELDVLVGVLASTPFAGYLALGAAGINAAYPRADLHLVLTDQGIRDLALVDHECADAVLAYARVHPVAPDEKANPLDVPVWAKLIEANTPGNVRTPVPTLVVQGDRDEEIPVQVSALLLARMCRTGDVVQRTVYAGQTHDGVLPASEPQVLGWVADRLAGRPAPASCVAAAG